MANIVITKVEGKERWLVESNNVETGWDCDFIWADQIDDVRKNGSVFVHFHKGEDWELTHNGNDGTWAVDSVDGVSITNNDQLATAIADIKG
jgi:hypothetical protein